MLNWSNVKRKINAGEVTKKFLIAGIVITIILPDFYLA